jgi:hypothetical protein
MCSTKFYPVFGGVTYAPSIPVREAKCILKTHYLTYGVQCEEQELLDPYSAFTLRGLSESPGGPKSHQATSKMEKRQLTYPVLKIKVATLLLHICHSSSTPLGRITL